MFLSCSVHSCNRHRAINYTIISFLLAIIYAFLLSYFIPMGDEIKDRANYLVYADNSDLIILKYMSSGVLSFFFNEPIWLGINILLSDFLTAEQVVATVVFFSAFISSFLVLKINPKYFLILVFFLFLPQVIVKYVVHLRQGLAISVFLLGWFSLSKKWRWSLFITASLIHSSFFFIIFLYIMSNVMQRLNFAIDLRALITVVFGLVVSFGLGVAASFLGARQAGQYDFSVADISGLGFIFWLGVSMLYWFQGRRFTRKHAFPMTVMVFYITTYFFIEVTGRIFESAIIIVLLSSLDLTAWRKSLFFLACAFYAFLTWSIRINQPWLGWGTGF